MQTLFGFVLLFALAGRPGANYAEKGVYVDHSKYPFMGAISIGYKKILCNVVLITGNMAITEEMCIPHDLHDDDLLVCVGDNLEICGEVIRLAVSTVGRFYGVIVDNSLLRPGRSDIGLATIINFKRLTQTDIECWEVQTDFKAVGHNLFEVPLMPINKDMPVFEYKNQFEGTDCPSELGSALYCENQLVIGIKAREATCQQPKYTIVDENIKKAKTFRYSQSDSDCGCGPITATVVLFSFQVKLYIL